MRVELHEPDPWWPDVFASLRERIASVMCERCIRIEHVGSTSVPQLAAKPIVDIVVTVDDPADEAVYFEAVVSLGYELRHREPDWYEHRVFALAEPASNLHVFADDCIEVSRMLRFRDHLRADARDRHRYESVKRELATRDWPTVQHYADAKSDVVEEILGRAD